MGFYIMIKPLFQLGDNLLRLQVIGMKWTKSFDHNQPQSSDQLMGCSFLKSSNEQSQFFLSKKLVSPVRQQQNSQTQKMGELKSPKKCNSKISLKMHREKVRTKAGSQLGTFWQSIPDLQTYQSPHKQHYKSDYFSSVSSNQLTNYYNTPFSKCTSVGIVNERVNQHCSQRQIKQSQFKGIASLPVINFVNPFAANNALSQQPIVIHCAPNVKIPMRVQSLSVKQQSREEQVQMIVMSLQSQRKIQQQTKQDVNLKSTTLSSFKLPPQLNLDEEESQLLDADQLVQHTHTQSYTPRKITESVCSETPIQKTITTESFKKYSSVRFGSLQYFKEQDRFRPVQKMQDVAEIVSVCESNASCDGDEQSIVLGRLEQFELMRARPRPQGTNYQKAYSECDSIVIFQ